MTSDHAAAKPCVLVIDDTPDNLALMNGLLKETCKVKVAKSGERGLALAMADPRPDLILLDILMPDMDGWEVCRRLKAEPRTRGVPVVFLSAGGDDEDRARARALGAADYVTKPIDPPVLLACVHTHAAAPGPKP